jgi:hypothetical protein
MSGEAENTVDYVEDAKHPMAPVRAKLKGEHMATAKPAPAQESLVPLNGDAVPAISVATPVDLLRIAVSQGADIDKLEKLMALQERWEKNEARKAFVQAMNKFKANPPTITKNHDVSFGETHYRHATLDHVCDEVTKGLSAVGITHAWKVTQDKESFITVICVLTHELGHSEETQLIGAPDKSGSKNSIQAIGSTVTYLQRYTLFAACGLAAKNDDDGRGAGQSAVDPEKREEYCLQLTEVETLADLKTVFARAYGEAQTLNDRKAMASYIQAKDKRKKEIEHANR